MFKSKSDREFEQKLLIKDTLKTMNSQVKKLEEQKELFLEKATEAKKKGLYSQVKLAISGYKMTEAQLRRAQEMLLNFEITAQMKDLTMMTSQFMSAMGVLSKDMARISGKNDFANVQKNFAEAMKGAEDQASKLDVFMDITKNSFGDHAAGSYEDEIDDGEIEKLIDARISGDFSEDGDAENVEEDLDKQIEELKNKINSMLG